MQFLHTFLSYAKGNTEFPQGEASQGPPGSLFQGKPHLKKYTPSNYKNFMTKFGLASRGARTHDLMIRRRTCYPLDHSGIWLWTEIFKFKFTLWSDRLIKRNKADSLIVESRTAASTSEKCYFWICLITYFTYKLLVAIACCNNYQTWRAFPAN